MPPAIVPKWLLEVGIEPRAIALYAHIAAAGGQIQIEALAQQMRCTVVSIYRYINALIAAGAVTRETRGSYTLHYEEPAA